uniref:Transmembrane protein 107 n=1 Tax=Equus caballus TaxID=9796 RepID=F6ZQI0_HORSE
MGRISGLVPSRFLTLLAHLVVVITLFWSRDSNIQACLPLTFTPEEYEKQDIQLVAALSVTLGLFAVELAGFFSGVSMFNSTQSLISPNVWRWAWEVYSKSQSFPHPALCSMCETQIHSTFL